MEAERDSLRAVVEGVAVMLNTELKDYESEPWAQRVRAALTKVGEQAETKDLG